MNKTGVLLIQLGTPDSPSVPDVRKYLREFLNDARVIDIPWIARKILVNLIIVPFRAPNLQRYTGSYGRITVHLFCTIVSVCRIKFRK